jgi:hypothetical protein
LKSIPAHCGEIWILFGVGSVWSLGFLR